jgi:hypothetical protein
VQDFLDMKRLARAFVLISGALFVAITVAQGVARLRPAPNGLDALGFAVCSNHEPCWRNVSPGETAWLDTQFTITQVADFSGPNADLYNPSFEGILHNQHIFARKAVDFPRVEQIGMMVSQVSLADVLRRYGPPCAARSIDAVVAQVFYSKMIVTLTVTQGRLAPGSPVTIVELVAPQMATELPHSGLCISNPDFPYRVIPWSGIGSLAHYMIAP